MNNPFLREIDYYQRDLNPLGQYIEQSAFYLHKVKGIDQIQAVEIIKTAIQKQQLPGMQDPIVEYYERSNFEDREIVHVPLSQYLKSLTTENLIMAPSLTCYVHASEKRSLISEFIDTQVKLRKKAKAIAAEHKANSEILKTKGDLHASTMELLLSQFYTNEQENRKLYANAASGAVTSGGSIMRNPSTHSSLTSTTRTMTSIGNAGNERLICGNRHYRNPQITLNNLVVIAKYTNHEEIRQTCQRYGLVMPSVEQTLACIQYSTDLYWRDRRATAKIREFVETLTQEERASIVYTGDLYHLRLMNEEVIRVFLTKLGRKVTDQIFNDPIAVITSSNEMYVNYAHQICLSMVRGIGKDYKQLTTEQQNTLAGTIKNLYAVLEEYQGLITAFFLTRNLPPSVAYIKDSMRRTVVLSDTDSTMFSCDEWVYWYFGNLCFTDEAFAISGAVMFLATQCIAHNLAIYSAQLNVERSKLFMAAMKPEFVFPVFALTSVGKHYFTYVLIKEGAVYKEMEIEIKGVHLKNSAAPRPIILDLRNTMKEVLNTVLRGEKLSLRHWVTRFANTERHIKNSIEAGETIYLGRLNIKSPEAYKDIPEKSNYRYHLFWKEIFEPKYGPPPVPIYAAVKFPTVLTSRRKLVLWIDQIQDPELRARMIAHVKRTQRNDLKTIVIPQDFIERNGGVPEEIKSIINMNGLILGHTRSHRKILETIGYYPKTGLTLGYTGY